MANKLSTTDAEKIMNTFLKEFNQAFKRLGIKEVNYHEDGFSFFFPSRGSSKEYRIKIIVK